MARKQTLEIRISVKPACDGLPDIHYDIQETTGRKRRYRGISVGWWDMAAMSKRYQHMQAEGHRITWVAA